MADVHDKATRSKNMRAIATRDTAIEKRLASLLTGQGLAFRVQDASLPGRPDFVVDEYRCVIFTHAGFAKRLAWRNLPTAASGIIITAICLKCLRLEPSSGWRR